jgi:hypothetical protein
MVRLNGAVAGSLSGLGTGLRLTPQNCSDGRDQRPVPLPGGKRRCEDDEPDDPAAA